MDDSQNVVRATKGVNMAFTDVIDDYSNGATGTLTTVGGDSVGYTVTANVQTVSYPNTDQGARVTADGSETVTVAFDQTVTGVTIGFDRSNSPEEYFIQINGVTVDLNTLIAAGDAEFVTTGAATHEVTAAGGVTSTGGFANGSLGFVQILVPVDSVSVFGTGGNNGNFDIVEIGIDSANFQIVCFVAGTLLASPDGPRRVEDLRRGDLLCTYRGAPVAVRGVGQQHVTTLQQAREVRVRPVRIAAGALGGGLPQRDLLVSRQHRLLVISRIAERLTGSAAVLIAAHRLVGLPGITLEHAPQTVTYCHVDVGPHQVLIAEGAPAESLLHAGQVVHLRDADLPAATPACPIPDPATAKRIVAAHQRHGRPLLESLATLQQAG